MSVVWSGLVESLFAECSYVVVVSAIHMRFFFLILQLLCLWVFSVYFPHFRFFLFASQRFSFLLGVFCLDKVRCAFDFSPSVHLIEMLFQFQKLFLFFLVASNDFWQRILYALNVGDTWGECVLFGLPYSFRRIDGSRWPVGRSDGRTDVWFGECISAICIFISYDFSFVSFYVFNIHVYMYIHTTIYNKTCIYIFVVYFLLMLIYVCGKFRKSSKLIPFLLFKRFPSSYFHLA